ncbi:Hcp family type VI secretion system effector [Pantoea sp. Cy-639]|uniref:Hcp family type VI secretion system effector n=1 Tax=Pantoea sp. Cy-639 TaxID=2608360 RepID=UPI00141EE9C0|nr:Hcp family type VI secretion system effector [Pantoea sp. Cy-639]NIF18408.1 Hcp family type VI secretion system effector [Pantoea sp. Cy-639]
MAFNGYMSINGKRQGLISAGCSTQPSIGNKYQLVHQNEITVLSFNHGTSNFGNGQRARHQPVVITRLIDKAMPLLAQAVDSREVGDCDIHLYRNHSAGHREKYFSVRLEGALIVSQELEVPHGVLLTDQDAEERLLISYRSISWIHHAAGTTEHASWSEQPLQFNRELAYYARRVVD